MYWMLLVTNDELIYKRGPQGYRDGRSWAVLFEEQTMPWLPKFLRSMWESVEGGGSALMESKAVAFECCSVSWTSATVEGKVLDGFWSLATAALVVLFHAHAM